MSENETPANTGVDAGNPVGGVKPTIPPEAAKALAGPGNPDPNAVGTANNPLPYGLVRQSRIKDRVKKGNEDSSLKIKIELDLEVELELYARVKGDVTIGLL